MSIIRQVNDIMAEVQEKEKKELDFEKIEPFDEECKFGKNGLWLFIGPQGSGKTHKLIETILSKLTYINIPILANLYIAHGLAIKAGVQPAYLLSRSWTHNDYWGKNSNINTDNIITGARRFDLSIPMGLSYEFSNFVFDFRYNLGLTSISSHAEAHNSVFMLTFGYKTLFK